MIPKLLVITISLLLVSLSTVLQIVKNISLMLIMSELVGFILWPLCIVFGVSGGFIYLFAFSVLLVLFGAIELVSVSFTFLKTS